MMKFLPFLILIITVGFLNNNVNAQDNTAFFSHYKQFNANDKENLYFRIESLNFFKNNEYQDRFSEGETLLGYFFTPKLLYSPTDNLRFEGGVRLQKFSGRNEFTLSDPSFTIHYQANPKLSFILGAINQDKNHNLYEPIFEPERYYIDKSESGFQILYNAKQFKIDTWINWEEFIFKNDPFQEQFTFGISAKLRLTNINSISNIFIPFQALLTHKGGEIDSSDLNVQTLCHLVSGLGYGIDLKKSCIKNCGLQILGFDFTDNSSFNEYVYKHGHAIYTQVWIKTKMSLLKLGYWYSNKFNSSRGSTLFNSVSFIDNVTTIIKRRKMITAKYNIEKSITRGILLGGQLNAYYDIETSNFSHSAAIFVRIKTDFFIKHLPS